VPFRKEDIPRQMDQWFSFHDYAKLMCHYLMTDLVEIKVGTWLFVCLGLLISAVLLLVTQKLQWHWVVISVQMAVALFVGVAVPLHMYRHQWDNLVSDEQLKNEWVRAAKLARKVEEEVFEELEFDTVSSVKFPRCARVEDFPMFSMQMLIFFFVYNIVRICGANYWWYRHLAWAIGALCVLLVTIPVTGAILARVVSAMALLMARGDVSFNQQHISWMYILSCKELQHTRRTAFEAHRKNNMAKKGCKTTMSPATNATSLQQPTERASTPGDPACTPPSTAEAQNEGGGVHAF